MLCDYGCEQEAKHQLKNGKWCCSESYNKCPALREKNRIANTGKTSWLKGKNISEETKEKIRSKLKGRKFSNETLLKMSISQKKIQSGTENPMYGRKHTEESKEKMKIRKEGFIPWNKGKKGLYYPSDKERERSRQFMLNGHASYMNNFVKNRFFHTPEIREKQRQYMLNGGAVKALKGVKNPSKPEVLLRDIIKEIYPNCEFQYQVLNYSIDVALPEHKIAIEYDGPFHFDCEKSIQYHNKRQKEIENEGWKFVRYNIFQKFPNKEKVISDIMEIKK